MSASKTASRPLANGPPLSPRGIFQALRRTLIYLFLMPLLAAWVGDDLPAAAPTAPPTVRLVIRDFDMVSGQQRSEALERGLPDILAVALLPYRPVEIIDRGRLWRALALDLNVPRSEYENNPDRIFDADVLRQVKTGYLLGGNFVEENNKFIIQVVLTNANTRHSVSVGDYIFDSARILDYIDDIALDVVKTLVREGAISYQPRQITVACFNYESDSFFAKDPPTEKDFASFLALEMSARSKLTIVKWLWNEDGCVTAEQKIDWGDYPSAIDAVVGGTVVAQYAGLRVYPTINIRESDTAIALPPIEGTAENYLSLKLDVADKLNRMFSALLTQEGRWNLHYLDTGETVSKPRSFISTLAALAKAKPTAADLPSGKTPQAYIRKARQLLNDPNAPPELAAYYLEWAAHMLIESEQTAENSHLLRDVYYNLGQVKISQRKPEEARELFIHATEIDPDYSLAQLALGDLYFAKAEYDPAETRFQAAKKIDPKAFEPYDKLGLLYYVKKDYQRALMEYAEYLRIERNDSRPYLRSAYMMQELEDYAAAAGLYRSALELAPADRRDKIISSLADLHFEQAAAAAQQDRAEAAVAAYRQSLSYRESARTYHALAAVQFKLGEAAAALQSVESAIRMAPETPNYYYTRANIRLAESKGCRDAIKDYTKALELDPLYAQAVLNRGLAYFVCEEDHNAEADFVRASRLATRPEYRAGALENIGLILLRQRRWQDAYDHTQAVNAIYGRLAWNWLFRSIAADKLGRREDAETAFTNWQKYSGETDVEIIQNYLPRILKSYLRLG